MPKESEIRDRLTKKLDVLEPGLTLVEVNHKLPNDAGAKGFIDILAKDQVGNIVIIELKRSDQAARQAMFEILKYMPLFRQHHGIPAHRIRCFIVSTTWHELRVAYSEFRRLCETQTLGFAINVDADGNVLSSEQITDHVEATPAQVFRMHVAYLYDSAKGRDEAFPILRQAYADAGAEGFLQVRLDYNGDSPKVIFPFAAYFVPTRIKDDLLGKLTKDSATELMEAEEDAAGTRCHPGKRRRQLSGHRAGFRQGSPAEHHARNLHCQPGSVHRNDRGRMGRRFHRPDRPLRGPACDQRR
jgi:hypothetical protein